MTSFRVRTAATAVPLLLGLAAQLKCQDSSATPAPSYFVFMRAGNTSPTFGYAFYNVGKAAFAIGVLADWRNAYREFAAATGLNLYSSSGNGATVMAAFADATDSRYVQLWVFPTVVAGRLSLTGFGGMYIPAEAAGVRQYLADPAALFFRIEGPFAVGASYSGFAVQGAPGRHGFGPAAQMTIPHGNAIVEVLRTVKNFENDVRITLQFTF